MITKIWSKLAVIIGNICLLIGLACAFFVSCLWLSEKIRDMKQ